MQVTAQRSPRDRSGSDCHIWFSGSPWLLTNAHRVRRKLKKQNGKRNNLKKNRHQLWTFSGSHCFSLLETKHQRRARKVLCGFVFLGNNLRVNHTINSMHLLKVLQKFSHQMQTYNPSFSRHHFLRGQILKIRHRCITY